MAPAPEAAAARKCLQPETRRKWPLACRGPCAPGMSSRVSRRQWKMRGRCYSIGVTGKGRRHSSHSTSKGAGKTALGKMLENEERLRGCNKQKTWPITSLTTHRCVQWWAREDGAVPPPRPCPSPLPCSPLLRHRRSSQILTANFSTVVRSFEILIPRAIYDMQQADLGLIWYLNGPGAPAA